MRDIDTLATHLHAELSRARAGLGLSVIALTTPEEMLAEAERISGLVTVRMQTIEEQLGTLGTTRAAARTYLASDNPI